jgi:hypothetical protein
LGFPILFWSKSHFAASTKGAAIGQNSTHVMNIRRRETKTIVQNLHVTGKPSLQKVRNSKMIILEVPHHIAISLHRCSSSHLFGVLDLVPCMLLLHGQAIQSLVTLTGSDLIQDHLSTRDLEFRRGLLNIESLDLPVIDKG